MGDSVLHCSSAGPAIASHSLISERRHPPLSGRHSHIIIPSESQISSPRISKLSDYFPTGQVPRRPYTDSDIREITQHLEKAAEKAWSRAPRLYIVFRLIGHLKLLSQILEQDVSDVWFPFSRDEVPKLLGVLSRDRFMEVQKLVLTKGLNLENGTEKKHAHFGPGELFPFEVQGRLGSGGYGTVDKIYSHFSGHEFARKRFTRLRGLEKRRIESFKTELKVLKRLQHHHCVELIASYTDVKYFGLIMSPVADCNLSHFLHLAAEDAEKRVMLPRFFGCLTNGLRYVHALKIRHRDIKPENILVKGERIYLTDFGISLDWEALSGSTTTQDSAKSWTYCAPEVAKSEPRNSSSDIWSLGCVFLEMFTVLREQTVADLRHFFSHETGSYRFYDNIEFIQEWIARIIGNDLDGDNRPIPWIRSMIDKNLASRPAANELFHLIANVPQPGNRRQAAYCCSHCASEIELYSTAETDSEDEDDGNAWIDDDESDSSLTDSSLAATARVGNQKVEGLYDTQEHEHMPLLPTHIIRDQAPVPEAEASNSTVALAEVITHPTQQPQELQRPLKSGHQDGTDTVLSLKDPTTGVAELSTHPSHPVINIESAAEQEVDQVPVTNIESAAESEFDQVPVINIKSAAEVEADQLRETSPSNSPTSSKWSSLKLRGRLPSITPKDWKSHGAFLKAIKSDQTFQDLATTLPASQNPLSNVYPHDIVHAMQLFLREGLPINGTLKVLEQDETPLTMVLKWEYYADEVAIMLLDSGAEMKPNKLCRTPFMVAASEGRVLVMKRMLETPGNINLTATCTNKYGTKGCTALHLAAENCHIEAVKFLVSQGASIGVKDSKGNTPFKWACANKQKAVTMIEYFLSTHRSEIDLNERDSKGQAVIHMASGQWCHKTLNLLLKHGADPNLSVGMSFGNFRPLHYASMNGDITAVKLLLQHEAKVEVRTVALKPGPDSPIKSNTVETPISYAQNRGFKAILEILKEAKRAQA